MFLQLSEVTRHCRHSTDDCEGRGGHGGQMESSQVGNYSKCTSRPRICESECAHHARTCTVLIPLRTATGRQQGQGYPSILIVIHMFSRPVRSRAARQRMTELYRVRCAIKAACRRQRGESFRVVQRTEAYVCPYGTITQEDEL